MLVQFTVENYQCFAQAQQLSMVAAPDQSLADNLLDLSVPGIAGARLLKSALIMGPNASGKSSLLGALNKMRELVLHSASGGRETKGLGLQPFLLNAEQQGQPSRMELIFVDKQVRFRYGFAANAERVVEEWLYAAPKRQERMLFKRSLEGDHEQYDFGPSYRGGLSARKALSDRTRPDALFVSVAAQFNQADADLVLQWFREVLHPPVLGAQRFLQGLGPFTATLSEDDPTIKDGVTRLLAEADLGITGFTVQERELAILDDDPIVALLRQKAKPLKHTEVQMRHGDILFPLGQESDGTQTLFELAGPILHTLLRGGVLLVDELDMSLHSLLTQALLRLFHSGSQGPIPAQIIFTAHDTNLLDQSLLRRDQIWLTAKDPQGRASLTPLSDFKVRKNEALERGYLQGRYGSLPLIAGLLGVGALALYLSSKGGAA